MSYPDNATASIAQMLFRDSAGAMYIIPRRAFHNGAGYGDPVTMVQDLSGNGIALTGTAIFDRRSFYGPSTLNNVRDGQYLRDVSMVARAGALGECTVVIVAPGMGVDYREEDITGDIEVTEDFSLLIIIDRQLTESEMRVITELARRWCGANWTPETLFMAEQDGIWLDPSDHSTLWIDEARTQNATQPGDVVWWIDDKSGNENHFSVDASANRSRLVRWPASAVREGHVRNLLTFTEDSSAWVSVISGETIITGGVADPDGGNNAIRIEDAGSGGSTRRARIPYAANLEYDQDYTLTVRIKWNGVGDSVRALIVGSAYSWISGQLTPGEWSDVTLIRQASGGSNHSLFFSLSEGGVIEVYQPQVEDGDTPTPYQRVGAGHWDVTEEGQPDCWGIEANGINNRYVSARGIPEYVDGKVRMLVGQTKQRPDSIANGIVFTNQHNYNGNNGYSIIAHLTNDRSYLARYRPTGSETTVNTGGAYPSPHTGILDVPVSSGEGRVSLRVNDAGPLSATGPAGGIVDTPIGLFSFYAASAYYEGIIWSAILTAYGPDETLWGHAARDWLNSTNMPGVLSDDD